MPHVRFEVPFLGPESCLKSGFACTGLLCSRFICLLLNKQNVDMVFVLRFVRPPVDFVILRSHFWYRQTVPKMGP